MTNSLIPALDPAPIPGPPWLFTVLWVVTFLIHLVLMNAALGGAVLAAFAGGSGPGRRELRSLAVGINSWAIALAITFGIAPLLFVQVLLGRFFYTATILVAWAWLGMLGVLTVAYYLNYVAKFRLKAGRGVTGVLWGEAVCFLAVAAVQVTVNLLHMQPGRWTAVAASPWTALADPAFLPRYLHFVLAAVALSGAVLAFAAVRFTSLGDPAARNGMARFGVRAALAATVLQLVDGFWLLLALPEDVLRSFMRGGAVTMVPLALAILIGVLLLVVAAQIGEPLAQAAKVRRLSELIVGAMLFMVVTRQQIRGLYLAPARAGEHAAVAPQWGVFALFLVIFLAAVAATVYAMVRAAKDRPATGEEAA